uniref:polymorphic toxin-type HINT domain-containing protein n=1 Tax=Zooshikella ganghwensis TaxID=202772 RepID=UPI0006856478
GEHPFRTTDNQWVAAKDLKAGDKLVSQSLQPLTVQHTEYKPALQSVYNLEVKDYHTYFVGQQGALVHNGSTRKCGETNIGSSTGSNNGLPALPNGYHYKTVNGKTVVGRNRGHDDLPKLTLTDDGNLVSPLGEKLDGLGFSSTTQKMRDSVKGKQYLDPLTNKLVTPGKDVVMSPDHVYPVSKIREMTGFNRLTKSQQQAIVHDTVGLDNIQALPKSLNESKSNLIGRDWKTYKGEALDPNYLMNLEERQIAARDRIQKQIKLYLKQNGG